MPIQLIRKIRAIQFRLQWIELCRKFFLTTGAAAGVLAIHVLAYRLLPHAFGPDQSLPYLGALWLAALIIWTWADRVKVFDAAVRADMELGLKERLSSAILIRQPREAAEMAVLADAAACAQAIRPSRQFPMRLGREFRYAVAPAALAAGLWFAMPQFDLWAKREEGRKLDPAIEVKSEASREAARELDQIAKALEEKKTDLAESPFTKQAEREIKELAKLLEQNKMTDEQAMAKMAKMADKMAERKAELEKKMEQMSDLKELGEGKLTREVQKALEKGNFEKAAQELENLKEKLQNGQLSEEEKKSLQEEMKKLAEKMEKEMGEPSEMSKALKEAAQKLSEGKTAEAMANMDKTMSEMQANAQMMQELEQMESLEGEMKAQQEAMKNKGKEGECQSCGKPGTKGTQCKECESEGKSKTPQAWRPGEQRKKGGGMGGPGQGEGSIAEKEEGDVAFEKKQVKGDFTPGKIIARMKVDGEQNVGEINVEYEDLRLQYEQKAEDSIQREMLPLQHKALVRDYFDAIKEQQSADAAPADAAEPAKAAAGDAKAK